MTKYIFVTGGVLSSLGKGLAAASVGALLESRGFKITIQKLDPYINVDPGTMSPFQHGEVFVTDDGAETDLDLGHYERFTDMTATQAHNLTTGRVYQKVIKKERRGDYLGNTVQVIPHITDEIKAGIRKCATPDTDVVIVEIGGTVGDIESLPFLEAIRQLRLEVPPGDAINLHLTYVPFMRAAKELKSKPTQHSVKELRGIGIQPDIILCRAERDLPGDLRRKIALFCNVPVDAVKVSVDVDNIYKVPIELARQDLDGHVCSLLRLDSGKPDLSRWHRLINDIEDSHEEVRIGIVGKYVNFPESYKSLSEALTHAGFHNKLDVKLDWIESSRFEHGEHLEELDAVDAVLIPGGFGPRGTQGMIKAIQYVRQNGIPYFGICLGMQLACVEFARNVAHLGGADSGEFDEDPNHKIIYKLRELVDIDEMGGTMRLGAFDCDLNPDSFAHKAYKSARISERHRHRYEFNKTYKPELERAGLRFTGMSPDGTFVEIVELPDQPWFLGCQFHPEFKSNPFDAHPLFIQFVKAAKRHRDQRFLQAEAAAPQEETVS